MPSFTYALYIYTHTYIHTRTARQRCRFPQPILPYMFWDTLGWKFVAKIVLLPVLCSFALKALNVATVLAGFPWSRSPAVQWGQWCSRDSAVRILEVSPASAPAMCLRLLQSRSRHAVGLGLQGEVLFHCSGSKLGIHPSIHPSILSCICPPIPTDRPT